jgi:hypothetical protein
MTTLIIKSQAEWDALPEKFEGRTIIKIESPATEWLRITKIPESAHVVARGSAHVEAWGSAHVEARGSAHVVARGSAHVEAWESAHVEAWGSAHVVARGSAHVEAWGSVAVHVQSTSVTVDLFAFAVAIAIAAAKKVRLKAKTATIIRTPEPDWSAAGWLGREGVPVARGKVVLYKRVSQKFQTQEGTCRETLWIPKTTVTHGDWTPTQEECGPGKFHACSRPYFCDEFRSECGDIYVAIRVAVKDLHAWPNPRYPHKIAFRAGEVIGVVDRFGKQLTP